MIGKIAFLARVLAVVFLLADATWAQTATGQITGTVTDATGATVAMVKIKVTSESTGLTRETTTSDRGTYSVPLLPVGAYLVTAEKDGFKLAASSANELKVDQVLRVDLTMELGSAVRDRRSARARGGARQRDGQHRAGHHRAAGRPSCR